MKFLSSYLKELKIAARGFYFYVELFVSILVLLVLFMVVKPWPDHHMDEYIYNDIPDQVEKSILQRDLKAGRTVLGEHKKIKLKPESFKLIDKETGKEKTFTFHDKTTLTVPTLSKINSSTGAKKGTVYLMPDRISVLRASNKTGDIGAVISMDKNKNFHYEYINQGYETKKYDHILYILHTYDIETIEKLKAQQTETTIGTLARLDARQTVIPVYVTFACCLMGFFVACSYIFLDKSENVIKAFMVTPGSLTTYLCSKIMVVFTTVFFSASLVTIPIMKGLPNYPLFYLFLLISTFAFSSLGLFISSFYDTMGKAFGVLYFVAILLMLPVIPYYVGSFDPLWIHFLPSWPALECFKGILRGNPDIPFTAVCNIGFLASGILFLYLTQKRFQKTICI